MLILNNKELNLSENGKHTPIESYIIDRLSKIKEMKELVFIENTKERETDNSGRKLSKSPSMRPLKVNVRNKENGSSEQWILCNEPSMKDGKPIYVPERFICGNDVALNPKQEAELIFFLTEFNVLDGTRLAIKDFEKEAKERIDKETRDYQVRNVVYSGHLSEDEIRMLAMSWGIEKAEDMSMNKLKLALIDKVTASEKRVKETQRGYDAFLKEAQGLGRETEVRALVQKAIEEKIIAYSIQNSWWFYVGTENNIFRVPPNLRSIKENRLIEFLLSNKDRLEELESSMEGKTGQLGTYSVNMLKSLMKADLIKVAKEKWGLDFKQDTPKAEILKEIQGLLE